MSCVQCTVFHYFLNINEKQSKWLEYVVKPLCFKCPIEKYCKYPNKTRG